MKRLLPILLAVFALAHYAAATNVSGILYGSNTWTKANSPYVVTGNLLVNEGATLIIEPGVEVLVDSTINFYIDGKLRAIGTPADPILFKPNQPGKSWRTWKGLECRLGDTSIDSVIFDYCQFSNADRAIYITEGVTLSLAHSQIKDCGVGVRMFKDTCYIAHNVFQYGYEGIDIQSHYTIGTIIDNEVSHYNYGISTSNKVHIIDNYIHHNTYRGLVVEGGTSIGGNAEITGNKIFYNTKGGMQLGAFLKINVPVHHNVIAFSEVGVFIAEAECSIANNTIKHNQVGVEFFWNGPQLSFKNNCIDSSTTLNLRMVGTGDLDLTHNYWGTTDSATLYNRMFDFYDDFVTGKAIVLPCLFNADASCVYINNPAPNSIPKTENPTASITLSPNPFTNRFTINLQSKATRVEVFNMAGQKLVSLDASGRNKMEVDMSAYPAGVYHYRVQMNDKSIVAGKLIKQ